MYCTVGQISKPSTVSKENKEKIGLLPVTKELIDAHANDVLCQNLKEGRKKDGRITVHEGRLLSEKAHIDVAIQIIVIER